MMPEHQDVGHTLVTLKADSCRHLRGRVWLSAGAFFARRRVLRVNAGDVGLPLAAACGSAAGARDVRGRIDENIDSADPQSLARMR